MARIQVSKEGNLLAQLFLLARYREKDISNLIGSLPHSLPSKRVIQKQKELRSTLNGVFHIRSRKKALRFGFLLANITILGLVSYIVIAGQKSNSPTKLSAPSLSGVKNESSNPIDKLSSADIAVHVARVAQLEEADSVVNNADTLDTNLDITSDDQLITKPQIVSTALKSKKDIKIYKVESGDTVQSVAKKFGVSVQTIKSSNGLNSDTLIEGIKLVISPVDGLVYTVQKGDSPSSIAKKFNANKNQLISFNDAELTGKFKPGEKIVVPNGSQPAPPQRHYSYSAGLARTSGFSFGNVPIYGDDNTYAYGFCTWGVKNLITAVPNNWGNASSWAARARLSGWHVSTFPTKGAIAQRGGGLGHVGIVTDASKDGKMIKYKDMNGLAGFAHYGDTPDWVPTATFDYFITQ